MIMPVRKRMMAAMNVVVEGQTMKWGIIACTSSQYHSCIVIHAKTYL
jgi:hypothetical protein